MVATSQCQARPSSSSPTSCEWKASRHLEMHGNVLFFICQLQGSNRLSENNRWRTSGDGRSDVRGIWGLLVVGGLHQDDWTPQDWRVRHHCPLLPLPLLFVTGATLAGNFLEMSNHLSLSLNNCSNLLTWAWHKSIMILLDSHSWWWWVTQSSNSFRSVSIWETARFRPSPIALEV